MSRYRMLGWLFESTFKMLLAVSMSCFRAPGLSPGSSAFNPASCQPAAWEAVRWWLKSLRSLTPTWKTEVEFWANSSGPSCCTCLESQQQIEDLSGLYLLFSLLLPRLSLSLSLSLSLALALHAGWSFSWFPWFSLLSPMCASLSTAVWLSYFLGFLDFFFLF